MKDDLSDEAAVRRAKIRWRAIVYFLIAALLTWGVHLLQLYVLCKDAFNCLAIWTVPVGASAFTVACVTSIKLARKTLKR